MCVLGLNFPTQASAIGDAGVWSSLLVPLRNNEMMPVSARICPLGTPEGWLLQSAKRQLTGARLLVCSSSLQAAGIRNHNAHVCCNDMSAQSKTKTKTSRSSTTRRVRGHGNWGV